MGRKKKYRLKKSDVLRNSGKEISHTILKIKKHERLYTTILVFIFMTLIIVGVYFIFRVNPSKFNYNSEYNNDNGFSYSSNLVFLSDKNFGQDNSNSYVVNISNMTEYNENYVIKLNLNDDFIKKCNCSDKLLSYDKIKYSIADGVERSIDNQDMILSTGFIASKGVDKLNIKIWVDESVNEEIYFYGIIDIIPINDL